MEMRGRTTDLASSNSGQTKGRVGRMTQPESRGSLQEMAGKVVAGIMVERKVASEMATLDKDEE